MVWKQRYELGVQLIDDQHRELFQRVEAFMNVLRSPVDWQQKVDLVNATLEFMKGYVVTHFQDEEAYQKEIGYPEYDNHSRVHSDMVQYVLKVSQEYEMKGYDERLMQQFGGKLLAWLINHVAAEDMRIGEFAKTREGSVHA